MGIRRKGIMNNKYKDIIDLPHHTSSVFPQMSVYDRAAQFSPFSALRHESAVKETARLTEKFLELDEDAKSILNNKLSCIVDNLANTPFVCVVYFIPDEKKEGGKYVEVEGVVKKVDSFNRQIILCDGTHVPFDMIFDITSELFSEE